MEFRMSGPGHLAGNERNVTAVDAEVIQFTSRQAVQFVAGCAVTAPLGERANDVHCIVPVFFGLVYFICILCLPDRRT